MMTAITKLAIVAISAMIASTFRNLPISLFHLLSELEKIAAALGFHLEIKFLDNETNQPII